VPLNTGMVAEGVLAGFSPLEGETMTTIESTCRVIGRAETPFTLDEDQRAVVAFLARFRGRTLEAYRP
jgi:hypothetical protein